MTSELKYCPAACSSGSDRRGTATRDRGGRGRRSDALIVCPRVGAVMATPLAGGGCSSSLKPRACRE